MKLSKKVLSIILFSVLSASTFAANEADNVDTIFNDKAFQNVPKNGLDVKRFVVPTNGIIALDVDGKVNLLSSNGRFVFQGTMYDTWAKKSLATMEDISKYASIIPIKELKLNVADLHPAVWGNGPRKVLIFTDPNCTHCANALNQLADLDPKEYTVNVFSLGALGQKSQERNKELFCASDRYRADRAIIGHDTKQTFEQIKDCDLQPLARRQVTAQVLGVSMIPFIIRDDGTYSIGVPKQGLKSFLEGK
ncbi:DsbC family protein [Photorhabdus luminescens]|uniref:Thiol:disulfide interchange protein n=1 Tax=Photorhabdus luminescens subsp. mexicana TaxID=2100167 RepID=A0A4R4IR86_PHOLU|nr:DsbC family protein [Photorhabdus luminescens]TDB42689.1 disulfide isomerase [Photorhabdus luminescens subsp. mexicana]